MDEARKEEARRYTKIIYSQLTQGCGYPDCTNEYCATSYKHDPAVVVPGNPNKMGALALRLALRPDYKEFVCRMNSPTLRAAFKFPRPITYDHFTALVQQAREAVDPSMLIREIGPVMGSPRSLGLSFLGPRKPASDKLPYETFDEDDYKRITSFYAEIKAFDSFIKDAYDGCLEEGQDQAECVMDVVAERLLWGLKYLVNNPGCLLEPYATRMVIIPFLCPRATADVGSDDSLMLNLAYVVRVLPTGLYSVFSELVRQAVPHATVRNAVAYIQSEITIRVESMRDPELRGNAGGAGGENEEDVDPDAYEPNDDAMVTSYVVLLALLHHVNDLFGPDSPDYIATAEWYNESLSDNIKIVEDYARFMFERSGFSFCRFAFILSVELKAEIFHVESVLAQRHAGRLGLFTGAPYASIKVRRANIVEDSIAQVEAHQAQDFRKELRVSFVGEDGIDMGGVKKEWFSLLLARLVSSPDSGLFVEDEKSRLLWFNPRSTALSEYTLIGKFLAIAMYNGVILEVNFPAALYKKLKGIEPTLADLHELHPALCTGLEQLLGMDDRDAVSDLDLNFTVTEADGNGQKVVPLVPDGENVSVTLENKEEYVEQYARYLFTDSVSKQFEAFYNGFRSIFSTSKIYGMLTYDELERIICGSQTLDWLDLEKAACYENGYTQDSPFVHTFWCMFHSLTEDQKRKFLRFATATERAPVGGLKNLHIVFVRNGPDSDVLPTASTCFNHLLIPEYKSPEKLKTKFLQAIQYATGFGLA